MIPIHQIYAPSAAKEKNSLFSFSCIFSFWVPGEFQRFTYPTFCWFPLLTFYLMANNCHFSANQGLHIWRFEFLMMMIKIFVSYADMTPI